MELGQVIDYIIEYNEVHEVQSQTEQTVQKPTRRKATQADWDAFWE